MNFNSAVSISNGVWTASLGVVLSTLESLYAAAYGEPKIDRAGSITYPRAATGPSVKPLDLLAPIGAATGTVTQLAGLGAGGYLASATGAFNAPLTQTEGVFRGNNELVGGFSIETRLESVNGMSDGALAVVPALVGLAALETLTVGSLGLYFGWGWDGSARAISLWRRASAGAAATRLFTVARASPVGIRLRMVRIGDDITCSYSLDNGVSWAAAPVVTMALQALKVGLFASSGLGTAAEAVMTSATLTATPTTPDNVFVIGTTPDYHLIRSGSPHVLSINGNVDPEAGNKVKGWLTTMETRATAANTAMLALPNPQTVATAAVS